MKFKIAKVGLDIKVVWNEFNLISKLHEPQGFILNNAWNACGLLDSLYEARG